MPFGLSGKSSSMLPLPPNRIRIFLDDQGPDAVIFLRRRASRPTVAGHITTVVRLLRASMRAVEALVAVAAERNAVSRHYGGRRSLIAFGDVERIFDDATVLKLAKAARLPDGADTARFGENIRIAVRIFLQTKAKLDPPRLKAEIERLYQLNRRAEGGSDRAAHALARAVVAMPADVRQWLTSRNTPHCRSIPTEAELLSPATRRSAVDRFRLVLSYGGGHGCRP